MADALGAAQDLIHELEQIPGLQAVLLNERHVLRFQVTMNAFDELAWDYIIDRVDDLGRNFSGEVSVELEMSVVAGVSHCLT